MEYRSLTPSLQVNRSLILSQTPGKQFRLYHSGLRIGAEKTGDVGPDNKHKQEKTKNNKEPTKKVSIYLEMS